MTGIDVEIAAGDVFTVVTPGSEVGEDKIGEGEANEGVAVSETETISEN